MREFTETPPPSPIPRRSSGHHLQPPQPRPYTTINGHIKTQTPSLSFSGVRTHSQVQNQLREVLYSSQPRRSTALLVKQNHRTSIEMLQLAVTSSRHRGLACTESLPLKLMRAVSRRAKVVSLRKSGLRRRNRRR